MGVEHNLILELQIPLYLAYEEGEDIPSEPELRLRMEKYLSTVLNGEGMERKCFNGELAWFALHTLTKILPRAIGLQEDRSFICLRNNGDGEERFGIRILDAPLF